MRERITVTVPRPLLKDAERVAKRLGVRSRSALVTGALKRLVEDARNSEVESEIEAYYAGLSERERAEEEKMVRAFHRSRRKLDLDES